MDIFEQAKEAFRAKVDTEISRQRKVALKAALLVGVLGGLAIYLGYRASQ